MSRHLPEDGPEKISRRSSKLSPDYHPLESEVFKHKQRIEWKMEFMEYKPRMMQYGGGEDEVSNNSVSKTFDTVELVSVVIEATIHPPLPHDFHV